VNVLSVGPGGLVDRYVERFPHLLGGRLSYGLAAAWALVECPRVRLRVRFLGLAGRRPDEVVERELSTYLLGLCNGAVFGGGMRLAPTARPDDGLLDVVSIAPDSKWTVARKLLTVYRGRHLDVPGVELLRCRGLEVELLDATAAELLPGALAMLAPARGASPEA
jgi:diacylglycerol kinase family enzyme